MIRVVDASVVVKWFVDEPGSTEARALIARGDVLLAPSLVLAEVANTAWKLQRRGAITAEHATLLVDAVPRVLSHVVPMEDLSGALAVALELDHAVYDAVYVALAEAEGAKLVTADTRLLSAVRGSRWQGSVEPLVPQTSQP